MELKEKLEILIKRNEYKKADFASAIGITMTVVMFPMVMILKRIVFNEEKEK